MTRRVCVVTGSRAEYGLLRLLLKKLDAADGIELQLIATGMHLSPEFGLTYREIEADGLAITGRVEMLLSSDTPTGVAKAIGLGTIGFADAFAAARPDLLVVLGDRFEIFAAAAAAMVARIPIAHLHGGETTEGAFDESIRHSLTKMSHLHFVAAEPYRDRVVQLGEQPDRVYVTGGLGVDALQQVEPLAREALEQDLGLRFGERSLMVTFHPPTLDAVTPAAQVAELLAALGELPETTTLIFTLPNADTGGREVGAMIESWVAGRANAHCFTSLGQHRYLSCLRLVDGVVGNSSSGLAEAPSFGIGTVNIGDRQKGRLSAASVIDCAPTRAAITEALARLASDEFRATAAQASNPYGDGGASERIFTVLRDHPLEELLDKSFYDLPAPNLRPAG